MVRQIYVITNNNKFNKDFALLDQVRRAAISVPLNIAEGFGRKTNKDFSRYLFIAHGSVAEVQTALYIAQDLRYITKNEFDELYEGSTEISKIISGLIKSINNK